MSAPEIRQLEERMLPEAVETFAAAFRDDDLYRFIVPDEGRRREFLRAFFAFRIRYGMKFGEVHTTSERCEGVAIWIPYCNRKMTLPRILRTAGLSAVRSVDATTRRKLKDLQRFAEDLRDEIAGPYWHLSPIAVRPEHQGKGYAGMLIRSMLERIDRDASACLLETQTRRNISIYEKFGFKVVHASTLPGSDVHHWIMVREAVHAGGP